MGDSTSSSDARSLRAQLEGLDRVQQHEVAYRWAVANGKLIDLLGFSPTSTDGEYENELYVVSDLKPQNVICNAADDIFVIDAEVQKK